MDLIEERLPLEPVLAEVPRWELYKLLSDPVRVRLLALSTVEELAVGELAELLGEGQPKVSRHGAALRDAGLVVARKNGTWVLLKIAPPAERDPVVRDAIATGLRLLGEDGTLPRVEELVRNRDAKAREFFARSPANKRDAGSPRELSAYLAALAPLLPTRDLAVDMGTGDGLLIEVLAPVFEHVIAIDRSAEQLAVAKDRARQRGFHNVSFAQSELDGDEARAATHARGVGADVVFASRVLHHAPKPGKAVSALTKLLRPAGIGGPSGALVVLDYAPHEDLALKEAQADLWLGFSEAELSGFAREAGLDDVSVRAVPHAFRGEGPDGHLEWTMLLAKRRARNV